MFRLNMSSSKYPPKPITDNYEPFLLIDLMTKMKITDPSKRSKYGAIIRDYYHKKLDHDLHPVTRIERYKKKYGTYYVNQYKGCDLTLLEHLLTELEKGVDIMTM